MGGRGVEEEEGHFGGNNAAADNGRSEGMMMPGDGEDATCSNCLNIVARSGRSLYIYIYVRSGIGRKRNSKWSESGRIKGRNTYA